MNAADAEMEHFWQEARRRSRFGRIAQDVAAECERQKNQYGEQSHPDGTGPTARIGMNSAYAMEMSQQSRAELKAEQGRLTYLDVLLCEVFEAAVEVDPDKLAVQLIQVAAVASSWVEKLGREAAERATREWSETPIQDT